MVENHRRNCLLVAKLAAILRNTTSTAKSSSDSSTIASLFSHSSSVPFDYLSQLCYYRYNKGFAQKINMSISANKNKRYEKNIFLNTYFKYHYCWQFLPLNGYHY